MLVGFFFKLFYSEHWSKSKIPTLINGIFLSEYPELIIVSGSDLAKCTGTYHKCGEKSIYAKKRPVYQLQGEDRYIYYYPNSKGWRIGSKKSLAAGENAGDYYYASKA